MLFAWVLVGFAVLTVLYAYVLYPLSLFLLSRVRRAPQAPSGDWEWPMISITIPVYNEASQIDDLMESVLQLDYPRERMQVLVVSDASDDGTDERVRAYADRGIELLRMPQRGGKTAAENAARTLLRGEIVVNTDASVRIDRNALKPLIARFRDPRVGLASGRDVSVSRGSGELNVGESGYVGYEMWLRDLETQVSCIVGASGCFYAIRRALHQEVLPVALSRDFAAALVTCEHGLRAVTVNEALCYVPRVPALQREYRRKVRTFTRGMETLYFKRHLLNPLRTPLFAWMLFSHKVCRWMAPWAATIGLIGILALATTEPLARIAVGGAAALFILALIGWNWDETRHIPRIFSIPAFLVAGNLAVMRATINAMRGELNAVWEPSRRQPAPHAGTVAAER
jgi:cellulose synthase/poly-beta-1,6-N-acetylglucosamine synthase-like glycosyltransferase